MRLIAILILTVMFFISPLFLSSGAFGESPPDAEEKAAPLVPFIKEAGERYAGRFPLKKVGSQYVPDLDKKYGPTDKTLDAITIPGTEITAGVFFYEYIKENGEEDFQSKGGVLINDSIYYVESGDKKAWGSLDQNGNANYGVYKNYFTMDSCASGAGSGCNRRMFLFKYTRDSVELLDVIMAPFVAKEPGSNISLNFMSDIEDDLLDNDGNPTFKAWISYSFKFERAFDLFFKIKDNRLQLDLNPELYEPLFKEIEHESRKKKQKPVAYYVYGFLSGKLRLKKIKEMLAGKEYPGNKEHFIVKLLKSRDTWDAEFHNLDGNKPVLIRHNLKRETGGK